MAIATAYGLRNAGDIGLPFFSAFSGAVAGLTGDGFAFASNQGGQTTISYLPSGHVSHGNAGIDPGLAELADGNVVMATVANDNIFFKITTPDGGPVVASTGTGAVPGRLFLGNVDVAALTGGGFVMVRTHFGNNGMGGIDSNVRVWDAQQRRQYPGDVRRRQLDRRRRET